MNTPEASTAHPLGAADCPAYVEDWTVCDDCGEPKGQCANCGDEWYEHRMEVLPEDERASAAMIQAERNTQNVPVSRVEPDAEI